MKNLPRMVLLAGEHQIDAYVARSREERALGLMHRRSLDENEGMLFVCGEPQPQRFWMKDTPLALSIAFMQEDGTIEARPVRRARDPVESGPAFIG